MWLQPDLRMLQVIDDKFSYKFHFERSQELNSTMLGFCFYVGTIAIRIRSRQRFLKLKNTVQIFFFNQAADRAFCLLWSIVIIAILGITQCRSETKLKIGP